MKIVIIPSEGGYRNIGDEAMFVSMVDAIKTRLPHVQITALTANPEATIKIDPVTYQSFLQPYLFSPSRSRTTRVLLRICPQGTISFARTIFLLAVSVAFRYTGTKVTRNESIREYLETIADCDAIINSGGGNLNDTWAQSELYPRCLTLIVGGMFNKPIFLTGQGIGPLNNRFARRILAYSVDKALSITLRDYDTSEKLLRELGVNAPRIESIGDDAILLPVTASAKLAEIRTKYFGGIRRLRIGLHFRVMPYAGTELEVLAMIADLIDRIVEELDVRVILIPMSYTESEDDLKVLAEIRSRIRNRDSVDLLQEVPTPSEMKEIIGYLDYAIGLSYHFLQFALSKGVPAIGMYFNEYYALKLTGLMRFYGLERYALDIRRSGASRIPAMLAELISKRDILVPLINNETDKMRIKVCPVRG